MAIQVSNRMDIIKPSATVSISSLAIRMREAGEDVISLSVGEPDFDTPAHIKQAAIDAIKAGNTKYTAVDGTSQLKAVIAEKFAHDNRLEYALDEILVSVGAKQACFNACQAILNTDDEVIIPAPYWVSYPDMAQLAGAKPIIVPTTAANGFLMQPDQLRAAISDKTRLLILNSPSNPTGAVYSRADLSALGDELIRHPKVCILSDDIYEHIRWTDGEYATIASVVPALKDRTITINGVSKAYAMTGWRIGYAAGPRSVIAAMTTLQSQSTSSACSISQLASIAALTGDQSAVLTMAKRFQERHDYVHQHLNAIEGLNCRGGSGAFYLFPNIEAAMINKGHSSDVAFCAALLEETGVALVPGSAFGTAGHMRLSFAIAPEILEKAIKRIEKFCSN